MAIVSPLNSARPFIHLNIFESSLPKNTPLCQANLKIGPAVIDEMIFKSYTCMYVLGFVLSPLWKEAKPIIWSRMFCAQFGWNRPSSSRLEDVQKLSIFFFAIFSPSKKGKVLHFKETESTLPNAVLCQVKLKLARWFWKS